MLNLFCKSQKKQYNLIKLYIEFDVRRAESCIEYLIDIFESTADKDDAVVYSINYSNQKNFNKKIFLSTVGASGSKALENLLIVSLKSTRCVGLNKLNFIKDNIFEIRVCFPVQSNFSAIFYEISKKFVEFSDVRYGYGRVLPEDYDPVTESKIKKSIFGTSVSIVPVNKSWLYDPSVNEFMLKGIYSINLLRRNVFNEKLICCGVDDSMNRPEPFGSEFIIVEYTENELREIANNNPGISNFVGYLG